jgi:hypothetical protein
VATGAESTGSGWATRLAQVAADPYIGDADRRRDLIERLRPRLSRLLIIDRPPSFSGHGACADPHFAELYGPALLDLIEPAGSFRIGDRVLARPQDQASAHPHRG